MIARHTVISARHQGRIAFRDYERLAREVLRNIRNILIMIVVADDIEGTAAEKMITWSRLIASGSDRPCLIILTHDIRKFFRQERIDGLVSVIPGKHVCGMPEIEDQIGLRQTQCIRICMRPLLKHFVSYAPHDD